MKSDALPIYDARRCTLFALGRNAMYAACQAVGLQPADEVLTPAFDCDGSLQPFHAIGARLRFFRSDPFTFAVDVQDLRSRITSKTRLLHVIHHFGMPQPWDKLLALRKETGIPILEDNAYSLFSRWQGRPFGTFGDLAVFSLRKNLPLVDGGMLRINNPAFTLRSPGKQIPWVHPSEAPALLLIAKTALGYDRLPESFRQFVRSRRRRVLPPPPLYSEDGKGHPDWPSRDVPGREFTCDYLRPMSRLARRQLASLTAANYVQIAEKKREHYARLADGLRGLSGITVLWPSLPEGIVPFCVSMVVDAQRDELLRALQERYDVMAWPTLPQLVLDQLNDFPDVGLLGRRLLQFTLPADKVGRQGYAEEVEAFIREVRRWAQEHLAMRREPATVPVEAPVWSPTG